MNSIFPPKLIKYNLRANLNFLEILKMQQIWSMFNKIFHFKGLANGPNGNEKFEFRRF